MARPFSALLLLLVPAAGAEPDVSPPEWKFDSTHGAFLYKVAIDHQEKGNETDRTSVAMELRMELAAVSPEGEGTWRIKVQHLNVRRTIGKKKHSFDSRKKQKRAPDPPIRWFAQLAGKELEVSVTKSGEVKRVKGFLSRLPSRGSFLAEGPDTSKLMAEALTGALVARLFRLPRAGSRAFCYGTVCALGGSAAGCHLGLENSLKAPTRTKHKGLDCTKLKWTSTLQCGGGSLSSGGAKLRLKQGPVGTGKGTGIYAPGFIASSSETVVYELPGPSRTVKFKRKFTIEFGGFVR